MSAPQNRIKDETKDKFDALLKQALNSKSHKNAHNQSTRKLTPDVESLTSSNENISDLNYKKHLNVTEIVKVDVHEDFQTDNFILHKFLNDTKQMKDVEDSAIQEHNEMIGLDASDSDVVFIKPPVPRPRKSKKTPVEDYSSPSSAGTYKIISPITKKEAEPTLEGTKIVKTNSDESSNLSISKSDHATIEDKSVSRKKLASTKTSEPQTSDNSPDEKVLSKSKSCTEIDDQLSERGNIELISDRIKYENEINPKRKRKSTPRQKETLKDVAETVIEDISKFKYTYEKIIGISVHKTDRLKLDSLVIHPVVKIHIVDSETGQYLKKSDRNRPVVFYYENKDITYITPVISEPYSLYEKRTLYPAWEETVMINEDINLLTANESNTVVFFEVMDFVSFSVANSQFNQKGSSKGWHKIAWAFLKPLGKNNVSNINKKARLQLYYPGKHKKVLPDICDIFHWWNNKKLLKYPASLYVSVKGIIAPEEIIITLRSKTPIHGEKGSRTIFGTDINSEQNFSIKSMSSGKIDEGTGMDDRNQTVWSRSSYQMCKLPNKCVAELPGYEEGCLMLKFSNNGLYLACAILIDDLHSIIIFSSVRKLIDSTVDGKIIAASYSSGRQFMRSKLCELIIKEELKNNPSKKIPSSRFIELADEINQVFLHEAAELYFVPYVKNPEGSPRAARGKLYSTYIYMRKNLKALGLITASAARDNSGNDTQARIEENEDVQWLKNNATPFTEVIEKWRQTTHVRITNFPPSILEYVQTYPGLSHPQGYTLFEIDFENLHPTKVNFMFSKWVQLAPKILRILENRNDAYANRVLAEYKALDWNHSYDELFVLLNLPLLCTTNNIKTKRGGYKPSRIEQKQAFILHLKVKTYKELLRYSGHQGLIYDINWSKDDEFILTASADCTVCIWSFTSNMFVEMLPHPSYVYTSKISSKNIIATGCYDQIIRIWCKANNEMSYNLFQELEGHKGYVTSVCFNTKSVVLYSSDAIGTIIEWKYKAAENIWNLKREIKLTDLRDTIINQILLHTRERRLLIHARDNALRIIDLKTGCVLYWLQGAVNSRIKTMCSFSPCGNFIFAGSENGLINVWNSDLGQSVASYSPYDAFNYQNLPVNCVQFHPHDNIIAVSHYGHNLPVLLIVYDATLDGKSNVALKMLQNDDELNDLQKNSKLKSLCNLKAAVRKIITEGGGGDDEKKGAKIKFEDVIQKIDEIVSIRRPISGSSKSSIYN